MDKSLHQQLYGSPIGRNAGSPRMTRQSLPFADANDFRKGAQSGMSMTPPFGGMPYKKSLGGGALNQSNRFSLSGRSSNHTLLGVRSDINAVESYGFQLPVLVNEALLNMNEKNHNVFMKCLPNGWAWVIHGRRLLIWQYNKDTRANTSNSPPRMSRENTRNTSFRRGGMAQCRELTLPHCDIGHKATLINVFITEGSHQMASCVAVSPTGDVRYWPSIAHDGSSTDSTGILDGQEFDYLLDLPEQQGYLLVTTTCNLVFLQIKLANGRHVLYHKTIRQQSSFLGGFGKKFASIIIGNHSVLDKENKFVSIACGNSNRTDGLYVTVLADRWLQRWRLSLNGSCSEQLLYEDSEIVRKIREEFLMKFWNTRVDNGDLVLHLLDMCACDGSFCILASAVNITHTPQMHYGVVTVAPGQTVVNLINFIPLKLTQFYSLTTEKECLSFHCLTCRGYLYIFTEKIIYPLNLNNPNVNEMEAEKIEFHFQDDQILSAVVCANVPIFFSRSNGFVSITPSDFEGSEILNISYASPMVTSPSISESNIREQTLNETALNLFDLDPELMYNDFKDEVTQMKAAFIYRLKRNNKMCNNIISELLRITNENRQASAPNEPSHLDKITVTIAEDLAEDIPAADPRWEEIWNEKNMNKHALGSSSSLQILTQLKEKNMAMRHFVEFLHSTGIWEKLYIISYVGGSSSVRPTCYALSDINEKIIAAIALKSINHKYAKIIDEAITHTVQLWREMPNGNLTEQDIFYVRLCKFQYIFQSFCDITDKRIEEMQQQSTAIASFICDINTIVLSILTDVMKYREQNASMYSLPTDKLDFYEYLPWTAMSGYVGVRDALSHLIEISVRYGAHCTGGDPELKQKIFQQILELIDFVLDGRKSYLESVRDTEKYNVLVQQFESQRRDLISILIEDRQYELAAKLAEKYLDFQSLVIICDETDNQERLDGYIKRFEEYSFSQFAINWHLRQNRQGEVFERFKGNQAALSQFMRDHPTLGWIQLVFNGDFERATKVLFQLAQSETEFAQRKKTMLSMAKLAALASADSDNLTAQMININSELDILNYQDQLNVHVLEEFGYDIENQKVLKVEEIINLLIAEENETANEFDFRKALELLNYIDDPYDARHKIWCSAIQRDNWINYDHNSAMEYIQNLLFFKLIEVCHLMDGDIDTFLPPMNDFLNSNELNSLTHNQSFRYLLKLTYEYVTDMYKSCPES